MLMLIDFLAVVALVAFVFLFLFCLLIILGQTMASSSSGTFEVSSGGKELVQSDDSKSAIDRMFLALLAQIESQNWQAAKDTTLAIHSCLQVTSGKQSRKKGGWEYSGSFLLDSVLFADLLRNLQERSDVMTRAVHLTLGLLLWNTIFFHKWD